MSLKEITDELVADLDELTFGLPVTHVYNPLVYARKPWDIYCEKYGQRPRRVLLLGMNPGPPGLSNPYEGVDLCCVLRWKRADRSLAYSPVSNPMEKDRAEA